MKSTKRRLAALMLCAALFLSAAVPSAAVGWADRALSYAIDTGMLPAASLRPTDFATRAELAEMVTRLMDLDVSAPLDAFPDVDAQHPHARALSRAVALGLLQGIDGELRPDDPVTREQAFVILSRAFALPEGSATQLARFQDAGQVGSWARSAVAGMVQLGYVQGSAGRLRPRDSVSRQELAQLLLNLTGRVYDGAGGTAIVPAGAIVPADVKIDGDLYLCCDAGSQAVLHGVDIQGQLVIRGAGTVTLEQCTAAAIVLCDAGVTLRTDGTGTVISRAAASLEGGATAVTTGQNLTLRSGRYALLTCTGGTVTLDAGAVAAEALLCGAGAALAGEGSAELVTLTRPNCTVLVRAGTVQDQIDYGLQNVTGTVLITAEPMPEAPTLRARLSLTDATPPANERTHALRVTWKLGEAVVAEQTVELGSSASTELSCPIDYRKPLPTGELSAVVTLDSETLRVSRAVNFHAEQLAEAIETIRVQATVHTGTGLFADMYLTQYLGWVNQGTTGTYTNYFSNTAAELELADGRTGWVAHDAVTISQENYVRSSDYTDLQKELYVNRSGYTSATDYLVWVSLKCQRVNVFQGGAGQWRLVQSFSCATGKNSTPTIAGVFAYQYRQERWDFGEYYVRPVLVFNGGHAFHSRTYTPAGNLLDATLGKPVSAGCVRMRDEDVGWLDQHLPLRSTVVVY